MLRTCNLVSVKKIISYLLIIVFFILCKKIKFKSQESENSKEIINNNFFKIKTVNSSKLTNYEKDALMPYLKRRKQVNISVSLEEELIGLGVKDSLVKDVFKKYWVDFNSICYPSALSLHIDVSKKTFMPMIIHSIFKKKSFQLRI